jgi:hypothetical protein
MGVKAFSCNQCPNFYLKKKIVRGLNNRHKFVFSFRTVRDIVSSGVMQFEPDRPSENKTCVFDNEQVKRYEGCRIGGEKDHSKPKISLCTARLQAYDQEGPLIQNKKELSPKYWLYNNMSKQDILGMAKLGEENSKIFNEQLEIYWDEILKKEHANTFQIDGHIEDNISEIVQHRTNKVCKCGKVEKNTRRLCSKCKEPLPRNPIKRFKMDQEITNGGVKPSPVERRRQIYENIPRGEYFKPTEFIVGKPLDKNPSKYSDTKEIIREESYSSGIRKYGAGVREWLCICCDGSPFKNFLALLPILSFCNICQCPAGDTASHFAQYHSNEKPEDALDLEFDHVLPLNGPGHTEKLIMEATTKLLWSLIGLRSFATWCDFKSEKAKQFLMNFGDHHKGWDFLYIIMMTISREIAFEFIKCWKMNENTIPKYSDLLNWISKNNEVSNIHLVRLLPIVNGPLLSMYFLRCGVRCGNPELYYSAYERASLTLFLNKNLNYQIISSFEQYLISVAPSEVRQFIFRTIIHREKKHNSWDCSGEGLDYRMEEHNRNFKQNLYTKDPTMDDWILSMANTARMEKMKAAAADDYNMEKDICEPYAPDYEAKIDYCRSQIRSCEYMDYDSKVNFKNLDEEELHNDTLNFEEIALKMKEEYLQNVVDSESFINAAAPQQKFTKFAVKKRN